MLCYTEIILLCRYSGEVCSSLGLCLDPVWVWRLKRATEASGAPGRAAEGAASCLTVCWTDYSLIAVDVKADEVITWPSATPC